MSSSLAPSCGRRSASASRAFGHQASPHWRGLLATRGRVAATGGSVYCVGEKQARWSAAAHLPRGHHARGRPHLQLQQGERLLPRDLHGRCIACCTALQGAAIRGAARSRHAMLNTARRRLLRQDNLLRWCCEKPACARRGGWTPASPASGHIVCGRGNAALAELSGWAAAGLLALARHMSNLSRPYADCYCGLGI